jgi:Flp pilus assembly protein TadD
MYSDPEVREREIKNMSAAYEALKTDILPRLRRSKLMVNVDNIGRTDNQILAQMKSDPGVLTLEEILHAGALTNDLNEKLSYYRTAAQSFPKCIRAHNNVGTTLLNLGRTDEAIASFDRAKAIENNDVVKNNTAFAYLAKGDFAQAEELFNSMTTATPESRYGLGTIAIIKGEYDRAVNFFGSEPSNNLALAQILKGDVNRAKTTLESLTGAAKNGLTSYLRAIVGSRLDDKNYMISALREALNLNSDMKAYAKSDLEFAKFFSDSAFSGLLQ